MGMVVHRFGYEASPRLEMLKDQAQRLQAQFDRLRVVVQQINDCTETFRQLRAQSLARRQNRGGIRGGIALKGDVTPPAAAAAAGAAAGAPAARRLTPRMRQILPLLMQGLSEKEVAARLGCSPHTVHIHVTRMYARLGVHSRAELLAYGYRSRNGVAAGR